MKSKNSAQRDKAEPIRLQKFLSMAGIASRRAAEKMIAEGKVRVNGKITREMGTKVIPGRDSVAANGRPVSIKSEMVYFLFYKPRGCLTTVTDDRNRITIFHYLRNMKEKVFPVGRLDFNTEGLLIITNDGDLAHAMSHPSFKIEKTYLARVRGIPREEKLRKLEDGFILSGGKKTAPLKASLVRTTGNNAWIQFRLREGKNRQIRDMCERIGHTVSKLKRVKIGPLTCTGLKPGEYRHLSQKEKSRLKFLLAIEGRPGKRKGARAASQGGWAPDKTLPEAGEKRGRKTKMKKTPGDSAKENRTKRA